MSIKLARIVGHYQREQFFRFAYDLYRDNGSWVTWSVSDLVPMLDPLKCGFYQHGTAEAWLAYQGNNTVGRIAGAIDAAYNQHWAKRIAFFGYYECIDDLEVAKTLFCQVEAWARSHGMEELQGPFVLSPIYGAGMLIEGFDDAPFVGMPYNLPYYQGQLERCGFQKIKDYYAFRLRGAPVLPSSGSRLLRRWSHRKLTFRQLNPDRLREESALVCDLYNDAFQRQWGHAPIDQAEFYKLALDWIKVLDPHLFVFVLVEDKPVGFCMIVPDVFQILHQCRSFLGLLQHLSRRVFHLDRRSEITRCRMDTLCIRKEYQSSGLGLLLWWEAFERYLMSNFREIEFSPTLEDNKMVQHLLARIEAKRSKVYRVFRKPLITSTVTKIGSEQSLPSWKV